MITQWNTYPPFDLHVLSTPPAFVLSQDQTLQKNARFSSFEINISNFALHSQFLFPHFTTSAYGVPEKSLFNLNSFAWQMLISLSWTFGIEKNIISFLTIKVYILRWIVLRRNTCNSCLNSLRLFIRLKQDCSSPHFTTSAHGVPERIFPLGTSSYLLNALLIYHTSKLMSTLFSKFF